MTKKTPETFSMICDAIVSESSSLQAAATAARISAATLFRWLAASSAGDAEFIFEWGDYGTAPLHIHVKNATRLAVVILQSEAVRLATKGFKRLQIVNGKVQYEERLDIPPGLSEDDMELGWGVRDRWKRDANGNLIPLYADEAPNPLLMTQVLKALGPSQWSRDERKALNVNHSGGVTIASHRQPPAAVPKLTHTVVKAAIEMAAEEDAPHVPGFVEEPPDDDFAEIPENAAQVEPHGSSDSDATDQVATRKPEAVETPLAAAPVPVLPEPPRDLPGDVDPPELIGDGAPAHPPAPNAERISALKADLLKYMKTGVANPTPSRPVNLGTNLLSPASPNTER